MLSKALDILELLQKENQPMTLEAIHRQTKISKTTVYRILKTLVHRGYLTQSPDGLYRHVDAAEEAALRLRQPECGDAVLGRGHGESAGRPLQPPASTCSSWTTATTPPLR